MNFKKSAVAQKEVDFVGANSLLPRQLPDLFTPRELLFSGYCRDGRSLCYFLIHNLETKKHFV